MSLTFSLSLFLQVVVQSEYPPANTQTVLEQAALSFYGLSSPSVSAPQGPQAILLLRSYMGDHPRDKELKGNPQQLAELRCTDTSRPCKSLLPYRLRNLRKDTHAFGQLGSSYQPGDEVWVKD